MIKIFYYIIVTIFLFILSSILCQKKLILSINNLLHKKIPNIKNLNLRDHKNSLYLIFQIKIINGYNVKFLEKIF
jgi:hypothetical protein